MWMSVIGEKIDVILIYIVVICLEFMSVIVFWGDIVGDIVMVCCILRGVGCWRCVLGVWG